MPTGKADPFGPQGEVLGQTFTVRVDNTKIGFPGSNKVSRTHSTSSERQATAASGASVQSSWSGSDYEDARSAYLRGEDIVQSCMAYTRILRPRTTLNFALWSTPHDRNTSLFQTHGIHKRERVDLSPRAPLVYHDVFLAWCLH